MNSDNISVLIRIRNGEQYVGFALQSVFDEFVNPEVIMLSDRCDDETLDIVQTFNSNDQGYVAVFGDQTPIWRGKKISKDYVWSHFGSEDQQNMWSKIENRFFLHNAFCFYSKEQLQQNKFNESMQGKEEW